MRGGKCSITLIYLEFQILKSKQKNPESSWEYPCQRFANYVTDLS